MNLKRTCRDHGRNERGVVIVLFAIALIVLMGVTGLAIDLGIAHVNGARLSKAVDAGALSGARHAGRSFTSVRALVKRVAAANFGESGENGRPANYEVAVDSPATDTYRVRVTGAMESPTIFARLFNRESIDLVTVAEATRYPLDLSLVLDLSYSLQRNNAFDDMQRAASAFLENFIDQVDRIGIVTYSTWAEEKMPLQKNFSSPGRSIINSLRAITDTNIEEGLRLGKLQLDNAPTRESSLKVVVLFTDGRPTAFADEFEMDRSRRGCGPDRWPTTSNADANRNGVPDCFNGAVASYISGSSYRGLFRRDNGLKVIGFRRGRPIVTWNRSRRRSPAPRRLPNGKAVNGYNIRELGIQQAEEWANEIRTAGYTIYAVGLGNPQATLDGDTPDLDFLMRIANHRGIVSASQPKGELLFSPSTAELEATFARLADRILTRLTK